MKARCPETQLSDVLQLVRRAEVPVPGVAYRQLGVRLWGEGAYEREVVDGGATKYSTLSRVAAGDIVVNKIWARNGSVAVVQPELDGCFVSGEFPTFLADRKQLLPQWMHWLTKTPGFWAQCDEKSRGTSGKNRIKPEQFLSLKIPLPPLTEQQRIVARIDELVAKVSGTYDLRRVANADTAALVSSTVIKLFTDGASRGWRRTILSDVLLDVCYGTSEKTHDDCAGVPVLRMGNIQDGRLSATSLKYLYLSERDKRKFVLHAGDVLVNRTNSAELLGKCAVFGIRGEFAFASYIIRLRIDQSQANPALIAAYINSPLGRGYIFSVKRQMTGQANVNSKTLRAMPIVLPRLEEQREIVAMLDTTRRRADALRELQARATAELDALLPSILDRAFKGEL